MARKNITSAIRKGFSYQDIWGLLLCARFLKDPGAYKWIWFETIPDDVLENKFFLDDILLCDNTDHIHAYQVKHAQNPGETWGWDELLRKEEKNGAVKDSLLQKWFKSYQKSEKVKYGYFLTNRIASKSFADCLKDGKVVLEVAQKSYPEVFSSLIDQLGRKAELAEFFFNFEFRFQQPDPVKIEEEARQILQQELGATDEGVLSLKDKIADACSQRETQPLTIEQLREWCQWDKPKPLNEKFEIPDDFVIFDKSTHERVLSAIKNPQGGIKVFVGKPGTGKSTYLSQLHQILREQKIISLRHHYHISPEDTNPIERLNANRVIEAIKAAIKEYASELGPLAYKNSSNVSIREYLTELAQELHKNGKSAVLIIDGLDHVLKYGDPLELKRFLSETIFPQPGLWILIGTQAFAKDYLPRIVFDQCPEEAWTEIPGLTKKGVRHIIDSNSIGLNLPGHEGPRKELVNKLVQLTDGNPLHLRYTLKQLKDRQGNQLVTAFDLGNLLPYAGDIATYYSALWATIPEAGKTLAILISAVTFSLQEGQLNAVLRSLEPYKSNPGTITEGFNSIAHLLEKTPKGVSLYHSSFEVFVRDQNEYKQQVVNVKQKLRAWLEASGDEDLKWAEARILAHDLGDPEPLFEIDRSWLIDAISSAREAYKITFQLKLGAKAAFKKQLFAKAFELSNLATYFENSFDFVEEASEKIWKQVIIRKSPEVAQLDLAMLSSSKIRTIAYIAERQGKFHVVENAIDEIADRLTEQEYRKKGDIGAHIPPVSRDLLDILPLDRRHDVSRVHRYIKQFENIGWSDDLFKVYVSSLLRTRQFTKVTELLSFKLTTAEQQSILNCCTRFDSELQSDYFVEDIDKQDHHILSNYCLLYLILRGKKIKKVPALPDLQQFPLTVKEYEQRREERARLFYDNFCLGVIYALLGRTNEVENWIARNDGRWSLQVMSALFRVAISTASAITDGNKISNEALFDCLAKTKKLQFPEDRDLYELQFGLQKALGLLLNLVRTLNMATKQPYKIEKKIMEKILSSKFYNPTLLLDCLLEVDEPWLAKDAYESFVLSQRIDWKTNVTYFPERAERYADLARLARIHADAGRCDEFIRLAVDNLLGYGYHKDMYLAGVLESIEICHRAGSEKAIGWIKRLAPLIGHINEYTDGDETSYLREELASVLVNVDRKLLYQYYFQQTGAEKFFLAENIFRYIIRAFDFKDSEQIAVATTALDEFSFNELVARAEENQGAKQSLEIISGYLGRLEYPEKDAGYTTTSGSKPEEVDYFTTTLKGLKDKLATFETRWDRNKFLLGWLQAWLARDDVDRQEVYRLVQTIIEEDGLADVDGELLDIIYPLAYEFDNIKAFEYLCWAQANDSGWQIYFTDKRKAERRWRIVKDRYPERHMEFFDESIYLSGKRYGKGEGYFVPIPRGVSFLTLFSNLDAAERITEASVKFAEELMANIELPASQWLQLPEIDIIDILIQRLCWPGALVRERAATAIASLLKKPKSAVKVYERLLVWLQKQQLESIVAIGLLPLLKSAEDPRTLPKIDFQKLPGALPVTSVVIEKLIKELCRLTNLELRVPLKRQPIKLCPRDYTPSQFFLKYNRSFLVPIYVERAEEIRGRTGRDFTRQWAYTAAELLGELSLAEELGDSMDFYARINTARLIGLSTMISEVYRTAFLRVLDYFHEEQLIPNNPFLKYAYATLPVELAYWKILPDRAPEWWPRFTHVQPAEQKAEIDLSKVGLAEHVKSIVKRTDDFIVLGFEGAIQPAEGWQKQSIDSSVALVAFAYKVLGRDMPLPEEVGAILYWPRTQLRPTAERPFNYLESYPDHVCLEESMIRIKDLVVYPVVARNQDLVIDLWQWFRDYNSTFSLSKELASGLRIKLGTHAWHYVADNAVVATVSSWAEGIKERLDKGAEPATGTYITIDRAFLESYLRENQLRLGYVTRTRHNIKKYSYEKAKVVEDYSLIGVSTIII